MSLVAESAIAPWTFIADDHRGFAPRLHSGAAIKGAWKVVTASMSQKNEDLGMPEHTYAVFDTETTGLDATTEVMTEIGWLVVRNGVPSPVQSRLIWAGKCVPENVAAITGITTRLIVSEGLPEAEALGAFFDAVGDLPLVGHNVVKFDSRFLMAACERTGLTAPHVDRYVDTAALFKARCLGWQQREGESHARFAFRVLEQRGRQKYNLAFACQQLGIDTSDLTAHRAATDVEATRRLYEALRREAVPV